MSQTMDKKRSLFGILIFIFIAVLILLVLFWYKIGTRSMVVLVLDKHEVVQTIGSKNISVLYINVVDENEDAHVFRNDDGREFFTLRKVKNNFQEVNDMKKDSIYKIKVLNNKIISIDTFKKPST